MAVYNVSDTGSVLGVQCSTLHCQVDTVDATHANKCSFLSVVVSIP